MKPFEDNLMVSKTRALLLKIAAALIGSSALAAGTPYFNLPRFLQDTVATTVIGTDSYAAMRSLGPFDAEMLLRARARPSQKWIAPSLNTAQAAHETRCSDFVVQKFADWETALSRDADSVPQWRHAFHGVSTRVNYRSGFGGLKHIDLAAAVVAPGIPDGAFATDNSGALSAEFFEAASKYKAAGHNRMYETVKPLKMVLKRQELCDDFVLYIWVFQG